jgi:hypothetical protein
MPWYSARLLYESLHDRSESDSRVFEDRIIVLDASSEDDARERARELATAGENRYPNAYGETVEWKFREVLNLCSLFDEELRDGSEVYFAFLDGAALEHVRKSLNFKFGDEPDRGGLEHRRIS